ncbi:bifunctional 3'-5' exonuclease/DNA polymerase [Actinotalea sp. M2MS4P-6]|uniref:bifunctional 3'-5' exonuclease/DNA polymerase n=1 Tax=Actinotalea sp. M2MS4P-6 TaxID=2983762 RepID=UPI0021E49C74|nr:bifunctional 3'-5' exonuclease/DNA polymerase [Actinotalea sp. M2MS4P-6]MCV2395427.1 bifunctional 3'-5' exonuclease/DNA polymerase [Actinotalea sp. M2MS4P-6]
MPILPLEVVSRVEVPEADLPAELAAREASHPRWVLDDTAARYPALLAAGVGLERCHDLRLCHAILRMSAACAGSVLATSPPGPWDAPPDHDAWHEPDEVAAIPTLFDAVDEAGDGVGVSPVGGPAGVDEPPDLLAELALQLDAVAGSAGPGGLRLLLAAESTGALIAAEIAHDGLPWDVAEHDRVLTALLGPRPAPGRRPAVLEELATRVRTTLDAPDLNPDSQPHLLQALRRAGLDVASTSRYEISAQRHPVVEPLLAYKKLARLLSANGWTWLDTWVHDGRYRPDYVVGGVVTGRWASRGSGALQLPAQVRSAVRADPGWALVVADAAQLEPRVLAAMSGDGAMAAAARGADLYQGLVDAGAVATRKEAKIGMLGAIYGGTTGVSGAVMPRLSAAFPRAIGLVESAARAGERGEVVSTWLGRSSPPPGERWWAARAAGTGEGADPADAADARRRARDWGRFTRNFVVQGTAAEWALCWLAALRRRLRDLPGRPHLVYFLHDEVVVHSPVEVAPVVADAVRAAAGEAGRLLFGDGPVEFPLDVSVVDSYDKAG